MANSFPRRYKFLSPPALSLTGQKLIPFKKINSINSFLLHASKVTGNGCVSGPIKEPHKYSLQKPNYQNQISFLRVTRIAENKSVRQLAQDLQK